MNNIQSLNKAEINNKLLRIISYFLIVGMMVCLSIAFQNIGEGVFNDWSGNYIPYLAALISLEAMYSRRKLKISHLSFIDRELWVYRASEWIVILFGLRVFLYVYNGINTFFFDLESFKYNRFSFISDGELIGVLILLVLIWVLSTSFGEDIDYLQIKPSDLKFERKSEMDVDRLGAKRRVFNRIFTIGMLLVFITIIYRSNLGQFLGESLSTKSASLTVLVYFGFAFVLMSICQFALLHGRWAFDKTPTQENIVKRWAMYSSFFLLFLIIFAILLPTTTSFGLFETIRYIFSLFFYITSFVLFLFINFVSYAYYFLLIVLGLFGREGDVEPPAINTFDQSKPSISNGDSSINLILSIIFWSIFIIIGFLAFIYYFRQNEVLLERVNSVKLIIWIKRFVAWILGEFGLLRNNLTVSINNTFSRFTKLIPIESSSPQFRFISLRKLSPREKVLFYYQAMLRRGREKGVERKEFQTPYQYMVVLQKQLPADVDKNLEVMTDSFIEARYSLHAIEAEQVSIVQQAWSRLKEYIKKLGLRG